MLHIEQPLQLIILSIKVNKYKQLFFSFVFKVIEYPKTHTQKFNLRWLPPVLHFPESLNFTKGFLTHHDGLVPVVARWCYSSF